MDGQTDRYVITILHCACTDMLMHNNELFISHGQRINRINRTANCFMTLSRTVSVIQYQKRLNPRYQHCPFSRTSYVNRMRNDQTMDETVNKRETIWWQNQNKSCPLSRDAKRCPLPNPNCNPKPYTPQPIPIPTLTPTLTFWTQNQ